MTQGKVLPGQFRHSIVFHDSPCRRGGELDLARTTPGFGQGFKRKKRKDNDHWVMEVEEVRSAALNCAGDWPQKWNCSGTRETMRWVSAPGEERGR